ncbi:hypothetical protein AGMMS49990_09590 [Endomicrobiia bacterium]|nr:hypothetical protein AGMMS49990_09590 [Endomicrobiia bacterium]
MTLNKFLIVFALIAGCSLSSHAMLGQIDEDDNAPYPTPYRVIVPNAPKGEVFVMPKTALECQQGYLDYYVSEVECCMQNLKPCLEQRDKLPKDQIIPHQLDVRIRQLDDDIAYLQRKIDYTKLHIEMLGGVTQPRYQKNVKNKK